MPGTFPREKFWTVQVSKVVSGAITPILRGLPQRIIAKGGTHDRRGEGSDRIGPEVLLKDQEVTPRGWLHRNPWKVRLVFLGGSTTECLHMEDDHRFPCQAGTVLERRTTLAVNSYNGGMAGNHSLHSIDALLNKVLPLRPRIVLMMHNINDLVILMHEGSFWNNNPSRSLIEVIGSYHVFRAVKNLLIPNLFEKIRTLRHRTPDEFQRVRGRKLSSTKP